MNELIAGLLVAQVIAVGIVGYFLHKNLKDARADFFAAAGDVMQKFLDHRMKQGENLQTIVNDVKGHVDDLKLHLSGVAELADAEAKKVAEESKAAFDTAKQEVLAELKRIGVASGAAPQGHTHCVKCGLHVARYTPIPGVGNVCLNCITEQHVGAQREG